MGQGKTSQPNSRRRAVTHTASGVVLVPHVRQVPSPDAARRIAAAFDLLTGGARATDEPARLVPPPVPSP